MANCSPPIATYTHNEDEIGSYRFNRSHKFSNCNGIDAIDEFSMHYGQWPWQRVKSSLANKHNLNFAQNRISRYQNQRENISVFIWMQNEMNRNKFKMLIKTKLSLNKKEKTVKQHWSLRLIPSENTRAQHTGAAKERWKKKMKRKWICFFFSALEFAPLLAFLLHPIISILGFYCMKKEKNTICRLAVPRSRDER